MAYNANSGTGSMTSNTATYDANYTPKANAFSRTGYTFTGWNEKANGSGTAWTAGTAKKYTYTSNITLYAQWQVNTYTDTIEHWAFGFKNGDGNNADGDAYKMNTTTFNLNYGVSKILNDTNAVTIPNGFGLAPFYGTGEIEGTYKEYNFGSEFTQQDHNMYFLYGYHPIEYTISYDPAGGINSASNPETYTVLYGVTFANPARTGYSFLGWYDAGGNKLTGVNPGANATFANATALYNALASRTTGDISVTAHWQRNLYTIKFYNNDNVNGNQLISEKQYYYGDAVEVPADPTRYAIELASNGYKVSNFSYWDPTKLDAEGVIDPVRIDSANKNSVTAPDSSVNYAGTYAEKSYTSKNATVVVKGNATVEGSNYGIMNEDGQVIVGQGTTSITQPVLSGTVALENTNGLVLWYLGTLQGPMNGRRVQK